MLSTERMVLANVPRRQHQASHKGPSGPAHAAAAARALQPTLLRQALSSCASVARFSAAGSALSAAHASRAAGVTSFRTVPAAPPRAQQSHAAWQPGGGSPKCLQGANAGAQCVTAGESGVGMHSSRPGRPWDCQARLWQCSFGVKCVRHVQ